VSKGRDQEQAAGAARPGFPDRAEAEVAGGPETAWWRVSRRDAATLAGALAFLGVCIFFWVVTVRGTGGLAHRSGRPEQVVVYAEPLDLNEAAWYELALLPGLGEKKARAVVAWREEHGRFKSLADLEQVKGVGPKTVEGLRPFLVVGGEGER
jgi:competence ComEA-like helix-hairpin-helix protein